MGATTGERQIGTDLSGIAKNHVARYEWAVRLLQAHIPQGSTILDAACGCAYGSYLIAMAGYKVFAFDRSDEAKAYSEYFAHPNLVFTQGDIFKALDREYDAAVSLETIEHIKQDGDWIDGLAKVTNTLVGTVPNQEVVPFNKDTHAFHERHYTQPELLALFKDWKLSDWATQYGKWERYEMTPGSDGMTLGFLARKDG